MNFKSIYSFIICSLLLILAACSNTENETKLVDLFTTASQDLIAIDFPAGTTEDIISINTFVDYTIEGLKSNGVDTVPVNNITWSLSAGAISTINQNGRLSTGSVAEVITINAKVGILTTSLNITVSAAKFDQVIKLNSTPVLVNMCQTQQIKPIGSYLNDDGTEEIRPVDNSVINTITWLIRNQEDVSPSPTPSQRAFIKTENNLTELQALETGNVIIQARAKSLSSGNIITSADFNQTLDHNLNSLKLCLKSETDLAACILSNTDVVEKNTVSLMAVANYQAADGTSFNQNISAFSKWGIDNTNNATIAFSADRQQLNVTGNIPDSTATISVACGNIEQTVLDSEIENGVVLNTSITCASGNLNCLRSTASVNIIGQTTITSLTVTANGAALVDNTALILTIQPITITLNVTANFSDGSSQDVTADTGTTYTNQTDTIIADIIGTPGAYTVLGDGDAVIQIVFQDLTQSLTFTTKIAIPI
ncbi:MAG: hypothetical protein BMS9Abin19_0718 [Gammaproteobacteria bacterium]|nr:MAG: hypothetical protein BMS9Abin19_0718 [Gammaproteobacteria bacterium]